MASLCRVLGCKFLESRAEHAEALHTWLVSIDASEEQQKCILNCLDDSHLLSLLRCTKIHRLPEVVKAKNFRILFYSNVAYALGWKKRRDFLDEIFCVARELWQDENEQPTVGQGICVLGNAREAPRAVSNMQTTSQARERDRLKIPCLELAPCKIGGGGDVPPLSPVGAMSISPGSAQSTLLRPTQNRRRLALFGTETQVPLEEVEAYMCEGPCYVKVHSILKYAAKVLK